MKKTGILMVKIAKINEMIPFFLRNVRYDWRHEMGIHYLVAVRGTARGFFCVISMLSIEWRVFENGPFVSVFWLRCDGLCGR